MSKESEKRILAEIKVFLHVKSKPSSLLDFQILTLAGAL